MRRNPDYSKPMKLTDEEAIEKAKAAVRAMLCARPAEPAAVSTGPMTTKAYQKPLTSLAMSVHPCQVKEFNEEVKAAGLTGVHYDDKGRCHFSSRGQRKALMQYRGVHDQEGGYGDG